MGDFVKIDFYILYRLMRKNDHQHCQELIKLN